MTLLALRDGIGRLERDGTVAVLDLDTADLSVVLAADDVVADDGPWPARRFGPTAPVRDRLPLDDLELGSFIGSGATIWGVGMNYASKAAVTGRPVPEQPTLFVKARPACDGGGPLRIPPIAPDCVDYEGEIAVVVGRRLYDATIEEAAAAVAGVIAANDVTARDVLRSTGNPTLAKSFPGFGQFGVALTTCTHLDQLGDLSVSTRVNGVERQRDTSAGMLLPVPELLALLSRYAVLRPGDLVLTGTPAGTGDEDGRYLSPGDVVEVTVGDLPPLVTTVELSSDPRDRSSLGRRVAAGRADD